MVNEVGLVRPARAGSSPSSRPTARRRTPSTAGWTCPAAAAPSAAARGTSTPSTAAGSTSRSAPARSRRTGLVAALEEAHRRDGRLPWREVVAPAIDVARGGFRLTAASRYYLEYVHDSIFGWDEVSRATVHDDRGELITEPIVVPDLARSLELIAAEGAATLHTGELAALISSDVLERGGILGPRTWPRTRRRSTSRCPPRSAAGPRSPRPPRWAGSASPRCCACSTAARTTAGPRRTSSSWCACSGPCSATGTPSWTSRRSWRPRRRRTSTWWTAPR